MTLAPGSRLGPYEVIEPIGAGGMGEVYRARDTRLGRDVALKTLPSELAADRDRLRRFEQEARSASGLNHPNIVTILDVDTSSSVAWIAMELVDGRTLRQLLAAGPLAGRKLLDVAAQIADGLARAHAAGISHRDLKPENVMVRRDGFVKILDFGLAKLSPAGDDLPRASEIDTLRDATAPGTVLGTVGYMSPEQAAGRAADFRSDQFSLGAILWELASGRRAFQRPTAPQTLAAIIQDDLEPLSTAAPRTPAPFRWAVERCLAKDPEERYASTRDLARELATVRDHASEALSATEATAPFPAPKRRLRGWAAAAAGAALGAGLFFAGRLAAPHPLARFQRLTFRRGVVLSALFTPDEKTVVYAARWEGAPAEIFTMRPESPESRSLGLVDANLLSISARGDLAIAQGESGRRSSVLAQMPLGGGTPRPLLTGVSAASWAPDGSSLAVARDGNRLEFPIGKMLFESKRHLGAVRVSPSGRHVAVMEYGDDAKPSYFVFDAKGTLVARSTGWRDASGLAWLPDESEIWFAASHVGSATSLRAMTMSGKVRDVAAIPGTVALHDISASGRVLLTHDSFRFEAFGLFPGHSGEKDVSWLDGTDVADISSDGRTLLLTEHGDGGGTEGAVYLRKTDGSDAVRLGAGRGLALSPDGGWVLAVPPGAADARISLLPTGPGEPRELALATLAERSDPTWFRDGRRFALSGSERGRRARCWEVDAASGAARPLSPEGVAGPCVPSPDGRLLIVADVRGTAPAPAPFALFSLADGSLRTLPGAKDRDEGWLFSDDGRALLGHTHERDVTHVFRISLASGERTPLRDLASTNRAGIWTGPQPVFTPDGKWYAYSISRALSELYLVDGLR